MDNREKFLILNSGFILKAELLYEISKSNNLFGFETLKDLCEAPISSGGLQIGYNSAISLISLYDYFVVEEKIDKQRLQRIGQTKLNKLMKYLPGDLEELLTKAEVLSNKDLDASLRGVDPETCEHKFDGQILERCVKCNKWIKR